MLFTQKDQLRAATKQQALKVMEREITLYQKNFALIASQASVLAGFSFNLLGKDIEHETPIAQVLFSVCTSLAIAFNLVAVLGDAKNGTIGDARDVLKGL